MPIKLSDKPVEQTATTEKVLAFKKEDVLMKWEAREFIQYDRNPAWILVVYILAALTLVYAIWTMNFLFAVLIVLFTIVIVIYTQRKPNILKVAIMKKGFKINDTLYTYEDDLDNFWILYNPPDLKVLNFKRKQSLFPALVIQLEDQNPLKVREMLLKFLPEDLNQDEGTIDKFSRRIGF
ncbi:MAG: hypothetical protein WC663_01045 [Patescibacteria group bacterium]|jgi:hypothetical protein